MVKGKKEMGPGRGALEAVFWGAEWDKEAGVLGKRVMGCFQGIGGSSERCWDILCVPG